MDLMLIIGIFFYIIVPILVPICLIIGSYPIYKIRKEWGMTKDSFLKYLFKI